MRSRWSGCWMVGLSGAFVFLQTQATAADCNGNGRDDSEDISRPGRGISEIGSADLAAPASKLDSFDLDQDGDQDLVLVPGARNGLSIVESLGGGRFTPAKDIALDATPGSLDAADLDGDHQLELIVTGPQLPEVMILRVTSGMPLTVWKAIPVIQSTLQATRARDLDGDGDLDLAILNEDSRGIDAGRITLFRNDLGGLFTQGESIPTVRLGSFDLLAFDLEHDGDSDFITLNYGSPPDPLRDLSVLVNRGARFEPANDFPILAGDASILREIHIDGESLVATMSRDGVNVLERGANSTLKALTRLEAPSGTSPVTLGDWSGDGSDDVLAIVSGLDACPSRANRLAVFAGSRLGFEPDPGRVALATPAHAAKLADVTGDGSPELVLALAEEPRILAFALIPKVLSADCDGDGVPDECQIVLRDCNENAVLDACDIAAGSSADCDHDATPDECELDCDTSGTPDDCDIATGKAADCNRNGIPDSCELSSSDRDGNGSPDDCDIAAGRVPDCNRNGWSDVEDLRPAASFSCVEWIEDAVVGGPWTSGDLNGDDRLDLVLALSSQLCLAGSPNELQCILNERRGWHEAERFGVTKSVAALQTADVDGDGDVDVAICGGEESLTGQRAARIVLLANRGGGQLARKDDVVVERLAENLLAEDFDLDGDVDLLASGFSGGATGELCLNLGGGQFSRGSQIVRPVPWGAYLAADLDENGSIDLIASPDTSTRVRLLLNDGHSNFHLGPFAPMESPIHRLQFGDVDGDGDVDFVASELNGDASRQGPSVYRNRGDASFEPREPVPGIEGDSFLGIADADGDRDLDVLAAESDRDDFFLATHLNDGNGRFENSRSLAPAPVQSGQLVGGKDWDADGTNDLLLVSFGFQILRVAPGLGPLTSRILAVKEVSLDVSAADLDGDGAIDLVQARSRDVRISWGPGSFELESDTILPVDSGPILVRAADLNADGRLDVFTANYLFGELPGNASVLLNQGGRRFEPPKNYGIERAPSAIEARDLDGDQDLDLAIANNPGTAVTILWNAGDGSFQRIQQVALGHAAHGLAADDIDGDGLVDLSTLNPETTIDVLGQPARKLSVLWNDRGKLEPAAEALVPGDVTWVTAADFDRDGRADLAAPRGSGGFVHVRSLPDRKFAPAELARAGSGVFAVAGDADGDSTPDLVSIDGQSLNVSLNDGRGAFRRGLHLDMGRRLERFAFQDLTGDGLNEVLGAVERYREILIVENVSIRRSFDMDRDGVPDECAPGHEPFVRGDANADGGIDITDAIVLLRHLFLGGDAPACLDSSDSNDDGAINLSDAIQILGRLFLGKEPLPSPQASCGRDPTPDAIGCEAFPGCQA